MEQCALRGVLWKAASPEAPHKGQIELCSPTSAAARVLGRIATRYTPPRLGAGARPRRDTQRQEARRTRTIQGTHPLLGVT